MEGYLAHKSYSRLRTVLAHDIFLVFDERLPGTAILTLKFP